MVTEIARRAEVNASLLYRWRRELRGAQHKTPTFVPVRVGREASDAGLESAPICSPQSPSSPARSSITIAFGVEVRMTIEGAPDASTLANVIGALTPDRFR